MINKDGYAIPDFIDIEKLPKLLSMTVVCCLCDYTPTAIYNRLKNGKNDFPKPQRTNMRGGIYWDRDEILNFLKIKYK